MQFSAKNLQNDPNLGVGAPPRENSGSATGLVSKLECKHLLYFLYRKEDISLKL